LINPEILEDRMKDTLKHQKLPRLKPDLLVVGQATIDDINREGEGLVAERIPGGDSIYAALGASIWPINIGVVTIVGQDYPYEKMDLATCHPEQTDWAGLVAYPGPSLHARAFYSKDGSRIFKWDDLSLTTKLSPGVDDIPSLWKEVRYVHLAPSDPVRQLELTRYFSVKGAVVSLDLEKHFLLAGRDAISECLKYDPIFIPSLEQVQLLSGIQSGDIDDLWPWISTCGVSLAVIKCGVQGAWVIDVKQKKKWLVGVVKGLHIEDVTGAGDSFCGGFMAGYKFTHDPLLAAAHGAVSASFIVESLGARKPSHYQKELVESRLAEMFKKIPERENMS
jgi:sugar/nucleoside kinase (ribokinase family)